MSVIIDCLGRFSGHERGNRKPQTLTLINWRLRVRRRGRLLQQRERASGASY
jgi:hypothetical protein